MERTDYNNPSKNLNQIEKNITLIEETTNNYGKNKFWQGFFLGLSVSAFAFGFFYEIRENYSPENKPQKSEQKVINGLELKFEK